MGHDASVRESGGLLSVGLFVTPKGGGRGQREGEEKRGDEGDGPSGVVDVTGWFSETAQEADGGLFLGWIQREYNQ